MSLHCNLLYRYKICKIFDPITVLFTITYRHISGMNATRAENILKYRNENGPFKSREELKKVKSIGEKSFEQCAGFIRIDPITADVKSNQFNMLDSTWIHPESYDVARKLIKKLNLQINDIGTELFIQKIKSFQLGCSLKPLEREYNISEQRVCIFMTILSILLCG